MMGRQAVDQSQLFYLFNLEEHIPADHLLRRLNPIVTRVLADLREKLAPFYSDIGRPSIDPELMIRMLIVGYCYGIRFERRLCEKVKLHLGYRWFCRLELDDKDHDHSTFSVNSHLRFRDSHFFRQVFEAVVRACQFYRYRVPNAWHLVAAGTSQCVVLAPARRGVAARGAAGLAATCSR